MNPRLETLHPYPFAKLRTLLNGVEANRELKEIKLSIGEPQHPAPKIVIDAMVSATGGLSKYPATGGSEELKTAIKNWLIKRFNLKQIEHNQIIPVNGTREALFAVTQALVSGSTAEKQAVVLMPNPFYQIYEGAALLSGAIPVFYGLDTETNQPDFSQISEETWSACELMYICTPGNPTGQSICPEQLHWLIRQAQKHNFTLVSDECYSELYLNEDKPCTGLLEACEQIGLSDYKNCMIFHSLSKRSNLPGLRSGFCAGDTKLINKFLLYRTYHGSAMPLHHQSASQAAWNDENHVKENRERYREKYEAIVPILEKSFNFVMPDSGFYLWLNTPVDDQLFTKKLHEEYNLLVVPGSYLARDINGLNPGENKIRLALVGELDDCITAAKRLCELANSY